MSATLDHHGKERKKKKVKVKAIEGGREKREREREGMAEENMDNSSSFCGSSCPWH